MTYTENLSVVELAKHYATYHDEVCLDELKRRSKIKNEKPDNQLVFDFHKDVVSVVETANITSVNDPWKEAYEMGRRVGFKQGLKEVYKEDPNEKS